MTQLSPNWFDYAILIVYFGLVITIGVLARRAIANSEDFLLSGRSLPAWVTGLAFISANLGAIEILGMAANGAQYGLSTVHFYWIGAVPAMVFLGLVMMPFYYGSKVRSVPEYLRRRFNRPTHLWNALSFAAASVLTAGVNLYALSLVIQALLGQWSGVVPGGLGGHPEPVRGREPNQPRHVVGGPRHGDGSGALVDRPVPGQPGLVVPGVTGQVDLEAGGGGELL